MTQSQKNIPVQYAIGKVVLLLAVNIVSLTLSPKIPQTGHRKTPTLTKLSKNRNNVFRFLDWVSGMDDLSDIKPITEGGRAQIQSATLGKGLIKGFNPVDKTFTRGEPHPVILKHLAGSNTANDKYEEVKNVA